MGATAAVSPQPQRPPAPEAPRVNQEAKKRRRRRSCPTWCGSFCTFFVICFLLVPFAIFAIAALLSAPLWAIECQDDEDLCSFYEWFKYIIGNIVGLGTPLTDYTPGSGHTFAEVMDLVIATWAVSLSGVMYGLVAALAYTSMVSEGLDTCLTRQLDRAFGIGKALHDLVLADGGMSLAAFVEMVGEMGHGHVPPSELELLFRSADRNGSGIVDHGEVERLIPMVEEASRQYAGGGRGRRADASIEPQLDPRVDMILEVLGTMREEISALAQAVRSLSEPKPEV